MVFADKSVDVIFKHQCFLHSDVFNLNINNLTKHYSFDEWASETFEATDSKHTAFFMLVQLMFMHFQEETNFINVIGCFNQKARLLFIHLPYWMNTEFV